MRYVIIKYDKLIVKDYRALEEVKKSRLKPKVTPGKKKIRNDLIEEKPKKKKERKTARESQIPINYIDILNKSSQTNLQETEKKVR